MAGSADITGRQNYVMGIGHPKSTPTTESPPVTVVTNPLTGGIGLSLSGQDLIPVFSDGIPASVQTGDIVISADTSVTFSLPNPYPSQPNAPVHPGTLFFPQGWNGARYWMGYTPYPASNSAYENPCVASSNDGEVWTAKGPQPLAPEPVGGYNADTHLFMSPDNLTMYLAYRERIIGGDNSIKVTQTTDGTNWTAPRTIISGAQGVSDFGSPSIWWNGTGWTCISHNLDAASPYPVRRMVSTTSDIYGAWGAPSTVTVPAFGSRQWWHSYHVRLASGQIVALFQDNASAGAAGFLYWGESSDDGASYAITGQAMMGAPVRAYRSSFVLRKAPDGTKVDLFLGDLQNYRINKHSGATGANNLRKQFSGRLWSAIQSGSSPAPDVSFSDSFNRADSNTGLGTASNGGSYSVSAGVLGISGNQAYAVSNGRVLVPAGSVNHEVSVRFATTTTGVQQWLIARAVDGSNYWRCGLQSPQSAGLSILVVQSIVGGNIAENIEVGVIAAGDTLTMRAQGATLEILVNGLKQNSVVMQTSSAGAQCGMQMNVGATTRMDNFVCFTL